MAPEGRRAYPLAPSSLAGSRTLDALRELRAVELGELRQHPRAEPAGRAILVGLAGRQELHAGLLKLPPARVVDPGPPREAVKLVDQHGPEGPGSCCRKHGGELGAMADVILERAAALVTVDSHHAQVLPLGELAACALLVCERRSACLLLVADTYVDHTREIHIFSYIPTQ